VKRKKRKKLEIPKKKSKRSKPKKAKKLWGLEPLTFPKYSRYYADQDYAKNLSEKDKEWLSKFNEEYYGNTFRKEGPVVHKKYKNKKRELYGLTNSRYRDMYNQRIKYSIQDMSNDSEHYEPALGTYVIEDHLIDVIDHKNDLVKTVFKGKKDE